MKFLIRADATRKMGVGHVLRCLALAQELIDKHFEVVFVGHTSEISWVTEKIMNFGFIASFKTCFEFFGDRSEYILILDSYVIPKEDQFLNKSEWKGIIVFVDEDTPKYDADLYIGGLISSDWIAENDVPEEILLKGLEFLPIRKSLHEIKKSLSLKVPSEGDLKTIIVVGGGSDPTDFCMHISKILLRVEVNFRALIFTNNSFPVDERFTFLEIGSALDLYLSEADIIFTTCGTSVWEFLYLNIPMGFALAAQNQNRNYEILSTIKNVNAIGCFDDVLGWQLSSEEILSTIKRSHLQRFNILPLDGLGVSRIFKEIMKRYNLD